MQSTVCSAGAPAAVVIDFDGTFIRENLLIAWVLFVLRRSPLRARCKLRFLLRAGSRGIAAYVLSHFSKRAESAVAIAYGVFRDTPVADLRDFILNRSPRSGSFALNPNPELLAVAADLLDPARRHGTAARLVLTSQGSCAFAVRTLLTRPDVVAALRQHGIRLDPGDHQAIIANRAEVVDGRFSGRLLPPIVTKYNRRRLFPKGAVFIGDDRDERVWQARGDGPGELPFIHYGKFRQAARRLRRHPAGRCGRLVPR